jgi:hypothetical protein
MNVECFKDWFYIGPLYMYVINFSQKVANCNLSKMKEQKMSHQKKKSKCKTREIYRVSEVAIVRVMCRKIRPECRVANVF